MRFQMNPEQLSCDSSCDRTVANATLYHTQRFNSFLI